VWVTVHEDFLLFQSLSVISFMSFVLCYGLINCFFNYSFYVCLVALYVLLSILCVLCFCIVLFIVSFHVYSCLFSIGV